MTVCLLDCEHDGLWSCMIRLHVTLFFADWSFPVSNNKRESV